MPWVVRNGRYARCAKREWMVMEMLERLEALLEKSDLAHAIATGLAWACAAIFGLVALAASILALAHSAWWLIGFVLFGLLAGASFGIGCYLSYAW